MSEISLIVPVYQVEAYIERCIDSILRQSFTDFELILIDDGSPDQSGKICDKYAAIDSRIHVIHQENSGLSAARNAGLDWSYSKSKSNWIMFIDSDDWIHPEMLQRLYNAAIELKTDVAISGYKKTNGEQLKISDDELIPKIWTPERLYVEENGMATVACGKLYAKSLFCTARFPRNLIHEDEFLIYKILFQNEALAVIKAPLYSYYVNPDSITQSNWTPQRMLRMQAIQGQIDYFLKLNKLEAYKMAVRRYVVAFCLQIKDLHNSSMKWSDKRKYLKKLIDGVIAALWKYRHDWEFKMEDVWVYEQAFPHLMGCYWIFKALKNKISKIVQGK